MLEDLALIYFSELNMFCVVILVISTGEVLGFENLVFSIFEFVHTLLENKFKGTVKKALPELIYYIILYMQITEEQVSLNACDIMP